MPPRPPASPAPAPRGEAWPALPYPAWKDTCSTLHLWCQIIGKVRLAQAPWVNHSWHATLYPTARGLTTGVIPHGQRTFQIDLDLLDHALRILTAEGDERRLGLEPRAVADVHAWVLSALEELELPVAIHDMPNEIPDAIPFSQDRTHASYDPAFAARYWQVLLQVRRVFEQFRTGFLGKVSPVHLFWGSLDLAVTRFSGRGAPLHPGGIPHLPDAVAQEAYSHEVSSAGFWPGGAGVDEPSFYSYAYPEPPTFHAALIQPAGVRYDEALREFILPYEVVRTAPDPDRTLMAFLETTYQAAADLAGWDRAALECAPGQPGVPRAL